MTADPMYQVVWWAGGAEFRTVATADRDEAERQAKEINAERPGTAAQVVAVGTGTRFVPTSGTDYDTEMARIMQGFGIPKQLFTPDPNSVQIREGLDD